jgi:hypothetical protein
VPRQQAGCGGQRHGNPLGSFLAFRESDDSWLPDHLPCQMRLFEEYPERVA